MAEEKDQKKAQEKKPAQKAPEKTGAPAEERKGKSFTQEHSLQQSKRL
jgi:hypothetical protein